MNSCQIYVYAASIGLLMLACDKKAAGDAPAAQAAQAAPVSGCGADYTDPLKEFCIKVPNGFTIRVDKVEADGMYTELINFLTPNPVRGELSFDVTVSRTNSYDEQLPREENWLKTSEGKKLESSGKTAGVGKWWAYTSDGNAKFKALAKSNGGMVLNCTAQAPSPETVDSCKSLRAYPK